MTTPLRERRRQMLRDEIVGAAQMLLAEKGHKSMSMDDLAAQVGVSKPTLYSYFGTKDEIVVAVAMRLINPLLLVLEADLIDQTPLERLTVFWQQRCNFRSMLATLPCRSGCRRCLSCCMPTRSRRSVYNGSIMRWSSWCRQRLTRVRSIPIWIGRQWCARCMRWYIACIWHRIARVVCLTRRRRL